MKKNCFLIIVMIALLGCDELYDGNYMEGRVKTLKASEITGQSAVLNGNVKIGYKGKNTNPQIVRRGFMWGTSSDITNNTVFNPINGEGSFNCEIRALLPNTKYFVRAYSIIEYLENKYDGYSKPEITFYGNTIEFITKDGDGTEESETIDVPPDAEYVDLDIAGIGVQKKDVGKGTQSAVSNMCNNSILGNFNDWRLPTLDELYVLYNERNTIGGFSAERYWSSNYINYNSDLYYRYVDFSNGESPTTITAITESYKARCVRTLGRIRPAE